MKQHRWQLVAITLVLVGGVQPSTAQAQAGFTGPPPVPIPLTGFATPGVGRHIATVDNFSGIVGVALMQGTGKDNKGNTLEFELDVRAMQGVYVDQNGTSQRGTFCFT